MVEALCKDVTSLPPGTPLPKAELRGALALSKGLVFWGEGDSSGNVDSSVQPALATASQQAQQEQSTCPQSQLQQQDDQLADSWFVVCSALNVGYLDPDTGSSNGNLSAILGDNAAGLSHGSREEVKHRFQQARGFCLDLALLEALEELTSSSLSSSSPILRDQEGWEKAPKDKGVTKKEAQPASLSSQHPGLGPFHIAPGKGHGLSPPLSEDGDQSIAWLPWDLARSHAELRVVTRSALLTASSSPPSSSSLSPSSASSPSLPDWFLLFIAMASPSPPPPPASSGSGESSNEEACPRRQSLVLLLRSLAADASCCYWWPARGRAVQGDAPRLKLLSAVCEVCRGSQA